MSDDDDEATTTFANDEEFMDKLAEDEGEDDIDEDEETNPSSKKEEEECVYNHPRNCEEWISQEVFKRGSNLPSDGIILLENWTFFLTYFNNKTSKISNEYVIVDCNCEIVYFGNDDPRIKNSIN